MFMGKKKNGECDGCQGKLPRFPGWRLRFLLLQWLKALSICSSSSLWELSAKQYLFKIVLLQYSWFTMLCLTCVACWFSYTYISTYSFSDSFPIYVITEYWGEFPVLSSRSLLPVYFIRSSLCMLIPSSWSIISLLPHISPLVTMFVLEICEFVPIL